MPEFTSATENADGTQKSKTKNPVTYIYICTDYKRLLNEF